MVRVMGLKSFAIPTVCLLAGVAIGWILPDPETTDPRTVSDSADSSRSQPAPRQPDPSAGRDRERRPGHLSQDALEPTDAENLVEVPVSLLEELSLAASTRTADQDLFSRDGKIESHLGISDREKALVQAAWRKSRAGIRQVETDSMVREETPEGSIKITVPDLSPSMSSLGDDFRTAVHDVLGANRADAFLAIKQIERVFTAPAGGRTYTVSPEPAGDGSWRFHMTLESPQGRRVWVGDRIPRELQHLVGDAWIEPVPEP